jgi:type IV pilus assembly protein PilB
MRILAVDDQPANLMLLKRVLEPAGFEVSQARSGAEALAVAQEVAPDLTLLDMHLPDMHGLDVLRRLQDVPWGARLRVVAMSALANPDDRDLWVRAGCVGAVEKPIDVHTFVREVSRWLPGAEPGEAAQQVYGSGWPDKLGDVLVANRLVTPEQLTRAVAVQPKSGKRLGQILVEQGAVSEDDIAWALSTQLGYPYIFLTPEIVDPDAVRLLPEEFMRERNVIPILTFGHEMTLAMVDPTDQDAVEEVVARTGLQVKRALALSSNVEEMQNRFFPRGAGGGREFLPTPATAEAQYFQFHLVQALQQGGSEIHFDPAGSGQARVRYRIQGVLVDRPGQSADLHAAVLRHLRGLTGAGDAPSTSSATTLAVGERHVVVVATFVPTSAGPAATVSISPIYVDPPDLAALGDLGESFGLVREAAGAASGTVLVGCVDRWARATLLHALAPQRTQGKVWALETVPVYRRPTISQTVVRPPEVPAYLRTAVDAGADVILIDDVSSREAMVAAVEAGRARMVLAGHIQGDVIGLLSQAVDAGGAALAASALSGVLAAQPIRLLCPTCKHPAADNGGPLSGRRAFVPSGCEACGFTGFKGRRLLVEGWVADMETRALLRSGNTSAAYGRVQAATSMMQRQGLAFVIDGLTSLEEVARVVDGAAWT